MAGVKEEATIEIFTSERMRVVTISQFVRWRMFHGRIIARAGNTHTYTNKQFLKEQLHLTAILDGETKNLRGKEEPSFAIGCKFQPAASAAFRFVALRDSCALRCFW
jgi:hypothetical protein